MTANSEGSLRILLILSAIDLLASAVTAGLVLFVVLVGADAGASKGDASTSGGTGLNQVELVHGSGEPELLKQGKPNSSNEDPDNYEAAFFGGSKKLAHKFYLVPSSLKKLSITSVSSGVELIVRPVSGDSFRLFIRCLSGQDRIDVLIQPLTIPDCVAIDGAKAVQIPAGSALLLQPYQAIPDLPKEERRTAGFAKYRLAAGIAVPSNVMIWGIVQ
jgi:hypothetical protein